MKYNLTGNITNVSGDSIDLIESQLEALTDGDTSTDAFTLSGSQSLILLCDLYNRYDVSNVKYYYSGSADISIDVAESENSWSSLSLSTESWGVYSDTALLPRWIRITHTSDGDSACQELEVYNEDSNVLFGTTGQNSTYSVDAFAANVDEIRIYNPTSEDRDFCIFIGDGENPSAESIISVGLTSSGTFRSKHEYGISVPTNFSWDSGSHSGTETVSGTLLTLSGVLTSGTYYSPVMNIVAYSNYRVFWEGNNLFDGAINHWYTTDNNDSVGVRYHNNPPSGSWSTGQLAESYDSLWSIDNGSLSFSAVPNEEIIEIKDGAYIQFCVTITGSHPAPPQLSKLGIEAPLVVENIGNHSYGSFYLRVDEETTSDKVANIISFYTE